MKQVTSRALLGAGAVSLFALTAAAALAMPSFDEWSAPASVETLPGSSTNVNTTSIDGCASVSPDGLTLAFNSFRTGNQQIYLATRSSTSDGFGEPVMLPAPINTQSLEFCPTISRGNRLYFSSSRHDPAGDLYVSRLGPKGWSAPERLGPYVNNGGTVEESVSFYEDDEGREVLVFSRRLPGPFSPGIGGKIYQSVDGAPASLVAGGPHSSTSDNRPSVTHDGRAIFWDSVRFGSLGGPDLWYATRSNTSEPFGQAIHLSQLSSAGSETRPFVGWNGELLILSSDRDSVGASDIYFSMRDKTAGR